VDIPDSTGQPDPKTWAGPWRTITNEKELATAVCNANASQYQQAHNTLFAKEPLLYCIGLNTEK
jgi:hypothetical protein